MSMLAFQITGVVIVFTALCSGDGVAMRGPRGPGLNFENAK